jgi:hypothetical protein
LVIQDQSKRTDQEFDAAMPQAERQVVPAPGKRFCIVTSGLELPADNSALP